jgi:hypothetical protein
VQLGRSLTPFDLPFLKLYLGVGAPSLSDHVWKDNFCVVSEGASYPFDLPFPTLYLGEGGPSLGDHVW